MDTRYKTSLRYIYFILCVFTEQPTTVFGDHLKQQVEDRLKFYESGETPRKNLEVMKDAMEEVTKFPFS